MDHLHEDCFAVFMRDAVPCIHRPDSAERPLARCECLAEARRLRHYLRAQDLDCVIRFVGPSGGGD